MDGTVLLADDDRTIRTVLTQALTRAGCKVHATASMVTLMRWVDEGRGDIVISDVVMPDGNGLAQLPEIARLRPGLPVIIISAQNTIMTAIKANEAEAYDYLPKPFDLPDLMKRVARGLERKRPPAPKSNSEASDDLPLVGRSEPMQALYLLIARVLNADLAVLVAGESGTGKSLIARALHDLSDRRDLPFISALSDDFQNADAALSVLRRAKAGSLVLEEVGDYDADAQGRVLRLLETMPADQPRIMATSQRDLGAAVSDGQFRADLYYRLNGVTLNVPSLRDRLEDIPLLADHFMTKAGRDGPAHVLGKDAVIALRGYNWPGNVRQLENVVRRLVVTGTTEQITQADVAVALSLLPGEIARDLKTERLAESVARHLQRYFDLHGAALPPSGLYERILREVEVPLIDIALESVGGNQAKCADLLGINRNTLRKKITELDIRVTRRRKLM